MWARDALYLSAIAAAAPFVSADQITRYDQDGAVLLTIDADPATVEQAQQAIAADAGVVGEVLLNATFVGADPQA